MRVMLNSLLNPKVLLFFMVFLPQFVDRDAPQVTQQLVWLGVVLTLIAVAFRATLGMPGEAIRRLVSSDSGFGRWQVAWHGNRAGPARRETGTDVPARLSLARTPKAAPAQEPSGTVRGLRYQRG